MNRAHAERGFTLIELLLAGALFALVALAGFGAVRQVSATASIIAERAAGAARVAEAAAALRADALSASAVWKPPAACGESVAFMRSDASGTAYALYAQRAGAFTRSTSAAPMNPCDDALPRTILVPKIAALTVTPVAAGALSSHADAVSHAIDGGAFVAAGITDVAVPAHANDFDGAPIASGNAVVEVVLDAGPVATTVDLVAGNRPSAYTHVLQYTCNGRCETAAAFPETRGLALTDCTAGIDFASSPSSYVPASFGYVAAGGGKQRIVITSYAVAGGYTFAFAGPVPQTIERAWPRAVWPPLDSVLAGTVADAYPLDYAANAVVARGVAQLATDLGAPAAFSAELNACAHLHGEPTYGG